MQRVTDTHNSFDNLIFHVNPVDLEHMVAEVQSFKAALLT